MTFLANCPHAVMQGGKKQISGSLKQKLDVIKEVNGDMLYLYLTPIISDELVLMTQNTPGKTRTATRSDDEIWHKRFFDYVLKCDTESRRDEILMDAEAQITSFLESPGDIRNISLELLTEVGISSNSNTQYVMHSVASTVGGTAAPWRSALAP